MENGLLSNAYQGIMDHDLLTFYCAKFGTATLASYEHLHDNLQGHASSS